ncbi:MAG: histidine phosphotransferase family protein [Stellaceae bacterium]
MTREGADSLTTQAARADAGAASTSSAAHRLTTLTNTVDLRVLELLSARLCHELSGPIAAINNGVELVADEDPVTGSPPDPSFIRDAVALVGSSARSAARRLQFYRFAYGYSQAAAPGGPAPIELARALFEASRIECDCADGVRFLSAAWLKLACNLLPVGAGALPRGGRLVLGDRPLRLEAIGEAAALSAETQAALMLATPVDELTARTVQAYFAGLLARALDCGVTAATEPGRVRLTVIAAGR